MVQRRDRESDRDEEKVRERGNEREWCKMRVREKNWCNSKALAQRTDCRRAMGDTREELLLHRESEWSYR